MKDSKERIVFIVQHTNDNFLTLRATLEDAKSIAYDYCEIYQASIELLGTVKQVKVVEAPRD